MPSSASVGKIFCSGPRLTSEYSICRSQIGCTACARRIVSTPTSESPIVADVAGLHHVGDRADGVFDRHRGIEARGPVDVDVIDAEPREAVGEEVLDGRGARVVAEPGAVGRRAARRTSPR